MANAIALAATANVPTRQTRSGELTMWKGCAAPAAARSGVFAAELAKEGMTGPKAAFEGRHGLWDQVTGKFELGALGGAGGSFAVERTGIKYFPTEYHSQVPLGLILKLREKVGVDDIAAVHVETYHFTFSEIGSEPEKWRPTTRETADHSLPYMLAAALTDGGISVDTFSDARIRDPKMPALMDRIRITENPEFTRRFPHSLECRIEITTRGGVRHVEAGSYPRGHAKNPMTDAEVEEKVRALCRGVMPEARCEAILAAVWGLAQAPGVGDLVSLMSFAGK
jgi:2-methylcitrate dehydratase